MSEIRRCRYYLHRRIKKFKEEKGNDRDKRKKFQLENIGSFGYKYYLILVVCVSVSELPVSVESVRENGYPINDDGKSYGPDVKESNIQPDLILVCNEDGKEGYIKKEDLNRGAVSLEQAQNGGFHNYQIPMYLSDGKSIVGYFRIK